ncbi:MAG: hypothetical protein EBT03_10670 [Betaproteobacteria bacterium]|nr:hypothetical protein [Betaproteobacteria bacterium]
MKITIGQLRRIIAEELDLGKIAFGGNRRTGEPFEYNTPEERELLRSISKYLSRTMQLSTAQADGIRDILSKGKYDDIFVKPKVDTVYRGISVDRDTASKLTGIPRGEFDSSTRGSAKGDYVITAKDGPITSWSLSFSVALTFARKANKFVRTYGSENVLLVFKASTAEHDGIMFDLHNLYWKVEDPLGAIEHVRQEEEVFGLGPITAHEVKWYHPF